MTREEAIETLKANYPDACYEQLREAVDTAIEALKALPNLQQSCNELATDTISRRAAIDVMCLACGQDCDKSRFVYNASQDEQVIICPEHYALSTLPSAQPEPHWIPCSERLPSPLEWDEKYLVSLAWGGIGVMEYKSTGFHNYGSFNPVPIETVIAWMPLPEPYKERRTDGGE